jgi:hypothetical protein
VNCFEVGGNFFSKRAFIIIMASDQGTANKRKHSELTNSLSPFERWRQGVALSVTDLASQTWCEHQVALRQEFPQPRSAAMQRGTEIHAVLESNVHQLEPIAVHSREDRWALKLMNCLLFVKELLSAGVTRELPVFGLLPTQGLHLQSPRSAFAFVVDSVDSDGRSVWVNGVIDEIHCERNLPPLPSATLKRKPASSAVAAIPVQIEAAPVPVNPFISTSTPTASFRAPQLPARHQPTYIISDSKTRTARADGTIDTPSLASRRVAHLQLQIYHYLYSQMRTAQIDASELLQNFDLDPNAVFSTEVLQYISTNQFIFSQSSSTASTAFQTLQHLVPAFFQSFSRTAPEESDVLMTVYLSQSDASEQAYDVFRANRAGMLFDVDHFLKWWLGDRQSEGVDNAEAWKCKSCPFFVNKSCTQSPSGDW